MEKPTTRYSQTKHVGGKGGHPFKLQTAGEVVKRIEAWTASDRLRGVQITMTNGKVHRAGKRAGSAAAFEFNLGETISELNLYASSYRGGRSGGFDFKTSRRRSLAIGPRKKKGRVQAAGGILAGLAGMAGADIDSLGFCYAVDVVSYYLKDVRYDLSGAEAGGLRPISLATMALVNQASKSIPMSGDFPVSIATSKHWTSTWGIKLGVKASGEAGVPLLANGKWEVSAETSFQYSWGKSETVSVGETAHAGPIDIEPGEQYRLFAMVKQGKINVPYTGKAVLAYEDGKTIEEDEKGVFDGMITVDLNVEIRGPFKPEATVLSLGAGRHDGVAFADPKFPELTTQTVLIAR